MNDQPQSRRDIRLITAAIVTLLLVIGLTTLLQLQNQDDIPFLTSSYGQDGTRALYLWLSDLGYEVDAEPVVDYAIPEDTDLIFVLEPTERFSDEHWARLQGFVIDGGTAVIAGQSFPSALLYGRLGFDTAVHLPNRAHQQHTPLWTAPIPVQLADLRSFSFFEASETNEFVVHVTADGQPVILSVPLGEGEFILSTTAFPFTNEGLRQPSNDELLLNLLPPRPELSQIWFDEWHHGLQATTESVGGGPAVWIRETAVGQSIFLAATIIFIALVLSGRRLGRPLPLNRRQRRRAPLEYIVAIGNLQRRTGNRQSVTDHYRQRLKQTIGRRYRLDPNLPDQTFVAELERIAPNLDTAGLAELLEKLNRRVNSERELVNLVNDANDWLQPHT